MHVCLISMPFGPLNFPSIALAQLTSAVNERFGDEIRVTSHYLVHDFGEAFGQEQYNSICQNEKSADPNYGDWVFSKVAFPDMPDNTDAYFELVPQGFRGSYRSYYETYLKPACDRIPELIETLIDRYALDKADVIGYTSMFAQTIASIAMAKAIRRRNPGVYQVMGGANCEFPMGIEYVHHFDCFDAIFSGPGLVSFPDFLDCFRRKDFEAIDKINGVFTRRNTVSAITFPDHFPLREKAAMLIRNGIREVGDERPVSQLLPLDYDDFLNDYDQKFSREVEEPFIVFETSRGCWWGQKSQCTFCGLNGLGMNYRAMDAESALVFLDELIARYRGRVEHFECVDNILPRSFTKEVFPYLNPPEDVSFFWEVKANLKTADLVGLAQGNVWEIQPGIEALNTGTLHLMKKGATAFTNIGLLRDAPMYEITVLWYLLMGFPGEPEDVFVKYLEDFPRLVHLRPPVALVPVEYHRFSPYYDQAKEYGLELAPAKFYGINYPLPEKVLFNLAYYFRDVRQNSEPDVAASKANAPDSGLGWFLPPSLDSSHKGYLKRHWNALNERWEYWQRRFDGSDGKPRAQLFFRPQSDNVVIDTRNGKRMRHVLSGNESRVLRYLNAVAPVAGIIGAFPDIPEKELLGILETLHDSYQLLFREGDRYFSLVPAKRYVDIPPSLPRNALNSESDVPVFVFDRKDAVKV
jgi:ribosomal peptide maturation radical SAM protein 1